MATYFNKNDENPIYSQEITGGKFTGSWEDKSGKVVEDYITRRLKEAHGNDITNITYDNKTNDLTLIKEDGSKVSGKVTMADTIYSTEIDIKNIRVNGVVYDSLVEVNYSGDNQVFEAGINLRLFYEILGTTYNISNKTTLTFSIEGTTDVYVEENVVPNSYDDLDFVQYINISKLFKKNLNNVTLKVTVTENNKTGTSTFSGITVHKIDLSTNSTYVDNKTVVFNIQGLNSTSQMQLEYYDVRLGNDYRSVKKQTTSLTGTSSTDLLLPDTGAHQIVARISNQSGTFYSNWVQANVVSFDSSNKEAMMAIIGGIPQSLTNCENSGLYKIIYVPGMGGEVTITSYLSDEAGVFYQDNWDSYIFNETSISSTANDKPATSDYYSYIELESVGNQQKFMAFKMTVDGIDYPIYSLSVDDNGNLDARNFFAVDIKENIYNKNNIFNYVNGARENYSQITGQSTNLFTDINPDIEASDGWTVDEDLIAYKVSGQDKDLFNTAKDYSNLINSGQGFTIEVMLKNYNVNGDDVVMNIGNLLFGPGFSRINSADTSKEGVYINSRADFEKDVITHLMFVFDPNYKPDTYLNIYDQLFNEGGVKYSDIKHNYPILKVYVNGTINREIEVTADELKNEDGFKLQIHPKSSDLNLYIFRTYTWAFNYNEIQKNYISSRTTSLEKKDIYDRNDILGEDGRISFYKTMQKNNVVVFVLPKEDKPLYFGNRKTNGGGVDPSDPTGETASKATILIHYVDPSNAHASGRLTEGEYKAQGSSAKKYLIHNTQYKKGKFLSETQIKNGDTEASDTYTLPTDSDLIAAKKMVGKVNYASSMQSHKLGSIKLYDKAYKELFPNKLYNGGKKACLEEAFVYFYYNLEDNSKLNSITIDDLYTTTTVNGITIADDSNVKFFGFQTWGSAKADDPTYGYDEDITPEYVLFEGADNASPGANFKQPWAAFQTWDSNHTVEEHDNQPSLKVQQTKSVTQTDYTTGLLIEGETIKFETGTDPLDVDYGVEVIILPGQTKKEAKKRDLWKFTDAVKNNSLPYFVQFYNNCYQYDFTNLLENPDPSLNKFDITNDYSNADKRIYMSQTTTILENGQDTGIKANPLDVYRWDFVLKKWVPAGLHHDGINWETYNLQKVYESLKNTDLYKKYQNDKSIIDVTFRDSIVAVSNDVNTYVIPAFKCMFKANCAEYVDIDDVAYHQAFIRLVSGTDNRAKNTYFQIVGKLYKKNEETGEFEKTETGDYKIRLMQDDLDTIFATDNNGQQVKPYYLLEPAFDLNNEDMWGDDHSSFFYPFDVCYYEQVNTQLSKLIEHLFGNATSIKDQGSNLYNYFFKVQKDFPEIAYNHHAEIYYEMPQVLFKNLKVLKENGNQVFPNTLNGFLNNNVSNPLSLSHGRCLESEYQFMKDRILMLGTLVNQAHGIYGTEMPLSTESTGGDNKSAQFVADVTVTDYFYPVHTIKGSAKDSYTKVVSIDERKDTILDFDTVFEKILPAPGIPSVVKQLATPNMNYTIDCSIGTQMGAQLGSATKYKTMEVKQGLDFQHQLLTLPTVQTLVIDGITSNYTINDTAISVKNFLPIVENLVITDTVFSNSVLDLRGCNRLKYINLSGCSGISDIIFPENNRLQEVYLPNNLKKLTLGKNPNLSTFVFGEGTQLTELSLDCSNFNDDFDYINILNNHLDRQNLKQFILRNTPKEGLVITEDIARLLADIKSSQTSSLIQGRFVIKDRNETVDSDNNTILVWGDKTSISYSAKKILVNAFGNIDNINNTVSFDYTPVDINRSSYKLSSIIAVDASNGTVVTKPFDALYFTQGNNVAIDENGKLKISYSITNLPASNASFDANTGQLTVLSNTNTNYNYKVIVTVSKNGVESNLTAIEGKIYLGYIEPAIGDYAYSDGTFSSVYNSDKTLVGLVFQKKVLTEGQKWQLGILSNKSIYDYCGPAYYYYVVSENAWSTSDDSKQSQIHHFMTHDSGLSIKMENGPSASLYLGCNADSNIDDTMVTYNYNIPSFTPTTGLEYTKNLATVGIKRINTFIESGQNGFKNDLENLDLIVENDDVLISNPSLSQMETVFNSFNVYANQTFNTNGVEYHKTLHPLALKAQTFEPENLNDKGLNYYSRGNWYIPSRDELEVLICYRIKSTCSAITGSSESYWDSTSYDNGNSIFSGDRSDHFDEFLSSKMIASEVSNQNGNFIYSENTNYNGVANVTKYGWFYQYIYQSWGNYESLLDCRRDRQYKITPCCTITVTKTS